MSKKLCSLILLLATPLIGCSLFNKKSDTVETKAESAFEGSSYQRDGSLLKSGVDPQAREIEERLGVRRQGSVFDF